MCLVQTRDHLVGLFADGNVGKQVVCSFSRMSRLLYFLVHVLSFAFGGLFYVSGMEFNSLSKMSLELCLLMPCRRL